jgi:hypothetical protein
MYFDYKPSHSEIRINSPITFKFGLILFYLSIYFSFSQNELRQPTTCIEVGEGEGVEVFSLIFI